MSGTIPLSMTQQFNEFGEPLTGGKLYFIAAGTVSTPQNAFQDSALTLPWPNPITLDAAGRVPQFFLADGLIKIRLTDEHGVTQLVADNVQVIGPSSGGGGGGASVDATTVLQTGDLKPRYGTGSHTGWVRCNGRTIGNSTSGATELQDTAKAIALFQYLWGADPNLVVSGGRGANAASDFAAGKTIALPDFRGRVIAGMDDMGAAAAGRLNGLFFGLGTTLGAAGGEQGHALTISEMPVHQHDAFINDPGHFHAIPYLLNINQNFGTNSANQATATGVTNTDTKTTGVRVKSASGGAADDKTGPIGAGLSHSNVQHTMIITIYIKL